MDVLRRCPAGHSMSGRRSPGNPCGRPTGPARARITLRSGSVRPTITAGLALMSEVAEPPAMPTGSPTWTLDGLKRVIARHWGFRGLRPLQEPAMRAILDGRDSLVVLPTGGGKSLCYQAPAVLRGDTTAVVSPLISLMKDQVDRLQSCGVPAVQINSAQSPRQRH